MFGKLLLRFSHSDLFPMFLLIGLVHGLLYVFLIPPWQHYDEPTQFEYVWLVANKPTWPDSSDSDLATRHLIAKSMLESGFYKNLGYRPNLQNPNEEVWIGLSQLGNPPAYYFLSSLPLRILRGADIIWQLYTARLMSLILYLGIIVSGWGALGELFYGSHPFRLMVTGMLALLPGFTDMMTAVNSDVAATLFFSMFLWGSLRLIRRGMSLKDLLLVVGTTVLCLWTKSTVWVALPLLVVVLVFASLRNRWRMIAWVLFFSSLGVTLLTAISWGDANLWYGRGTQGTFTRMSYPQSPWGDYVFRLDIIPQEEFPALIQPISPNMIKDLAGQTITLGAWIWASQPITAQLPALALIMLDGPVFLQPVSVGVAPGFYAETFVVPQGATYASIKIAPLITKVDKQISIFYDGVVLVRGEWPKNETPHFSDANATQGSWGGKSFRNLIRNASAEQPGPSVRQWANQLGAKIIPAYPRTYPSDVLVSLLDWEGAGWYYYIVGYRIFHTFWAMFAWGNVPLLGFSPYLVLLAFTVAGLLGAMLAIWRSRHSLPWDVVTLLGLSLVVVWGEALMRGLGSLTDFVYYPVARYGYPVIIPTIMCLCLGWREMLNRVGLRLHLSVSIQSLIYWGGLLVLDILSVVSIIKHFYLA